MTTSQSDWFSQMQSLVESNSRSIQALTNDIAEFKLTVAADHEQARAERQELRQAMIGIANLVGSLDSDRPTILTRLRRIEDKVDRLLEKNNPTQE